MNIWKLCPGKGFWRILLNSTIDVLGYLVCHGLEPTYLKYHSGKEYVGFGVTVRESGIMANLGHIKAFVLKKILFKNDLLQWNLYTLLNSQNVIKINQFFRLIDVKKESICGN